MRAVISIMQVMVQSYGERMQVEDQVSVACVYGISSTVEYRQVKRERGKG